MEPVLVHATVPASNCQWFHPFSRPYNVPIPPFPRKQHKLHNPREEDEAEEKEVEEVEETRGRLTSFMAAEAKLGKTFTYDDVGWRRPTKTSLSTGEKAEAPHFLHACALCKKTLGTNDIFMYRGDTPFCSEECRQEQMDRDEMKERKWTNLAAKALARKDKNKDSIQLTATETLVPG